MPSTHARVAASSAHEASLAQCRFVFKMTNSPGFSSAFTHDRPATPSKSIISQVSVAFLAITDSNVLVDSCASIFGIARLDRASCRFPRQSLNMSAQSGFSVALTFCFCMDALLQRLGLLFLSAFFLESTGFYPFPATKLAKLGQTASGSNSRRHNPWVCP